MKVKIPDDVIYLLMEKTKTSNPEEHNVIIKLLNEIGWGLGKLNLIYLIIILEKKGIDINWEADE